MIQNLDVYLWGNNLGTLIAILCVCVAFLGIALSLFTLSVAFVVSGKATRTDLMDYIKENGVSINNRAKLIKNNNATDLMAEVAKKSLFWLVFNFLVTCLLVFYVLLETESWRTFVSILCIVYLLISLYCAYTIFSTIFSWYKKHIKN